MVRLDRTRADTLSYYARTRAAKVAASVAIVATVAGLSIWQYPNAASAVEGWAAGLSGRDEVLAAQSELSDALGRASDVTSSAPEGSGLDVTPVATLIEECDDIRGAGEATAMFDCSIRLVAATDILAGQVERHTTATQILALEQKATEATAQREAEAAAAAQKAAEEQAAREAAQAQAEEAARQAAEDERRRQQGQQPQQPSQPVSPPRPNPNPGSGGGGGSTLSTTVTCNSRQTVTASASGGGTVTVSISGAGSASNSGGGGATASATGSGTFTIIAKSTGGGLTLNPSWTGACW